MAPRPKPKLPTDGELDILRVLWAIGPATVRDVHEALNKERAAGHTTVLKLMQIMTDKGLLERDTSRRPQVFHPVEAQGKLQRRLVTDLLDRAFSGSAGRLALHALSTKRASKAELDEIRELLARLESEEEA